MAAHSHSHGHSPSTADGPLPLVGHLVPISTLCVTGFILIVLTVVTVAAHDYLDVGEFNIVIALTIALIKGTFVGLIFMHLRWDRPFNQVIFVSSILLVALLMAFCTMDSKQYQKTLIPGNPKLAQETLNQLAPTAPIAAKKADQRCLVLPTDKRQIFATEAARQAAGRFGIWLFILGLSIIFVSTIIGYVVVRIGPTNVGHWPPPGAPPLPLTLVASTLVLLASDATFHVAHVASSRGERATGGWMIATLVLAIGFIALQLVAWVSAARSNMILTHDLYAWTFYVLTALHAAHVVGGIIPMSIVTGRALRGRYGPSHDSGVAYTALYWHFLDVVWLALYATLWWGSQKW